jgi:urease accessory protein
MSEIQYYTPADIPPEVLAYDQKLDQLGIGKAGKIGALVLKLENDVQRNKTIITNQYSRVPLFTQRALYLEESLPSMAYVFIISPSGGILQGDRYRMDITVTNNACAHITTQGATRLYRMEKNFATQMVNVSVDEGCYFEFIPDQIIPYRDSRFYQTLNFKVHENATAVYSEMVVPGRVASGESFEYDICYLKAVARDYLNNLRFIDIAILEPKKRNLSNIGILGNYTVVGSVYVLAQRRYVRILNDEINAKLREADSIVGGSSILPGSSGIVVRMLGHLAGDIRNAIFEVLTIVRKHVLNANFSGLRKG